jgi:hypothetical protein
MKKQKTITLTILFLFGILFQACSNETIVEPTKQDEAIVSNSEIAQIVATELSKSTSGGTTLSAMNDLLIIAQSPEDIQEGDIAGLIKNDSTIVYEGDTYKTTLTYEVKYKINNLVVEDYSLLADTALIYYTIESEYNKIQFSGKREAYSDDFVVSGIKMPTTKFTVNMNSFFRTDIEYKVEPYFLLYINGTTYFEDIVVDIYNSVIESGTGGMEFKISTEELESEPIIVEIEFIGNNKAIIRVNGDEYNVDIALGELLA